MLYNDNIGFYRIGSRNRIPTTRINSLQQVNRFEKEINAIDGKLSNLPRADKPGQQTIVEFKNGYGISFVINNMSRGLEAAILEVYSDEDKWDITYDTPITDDVINYMNDKDILPLCKKVSELKDRRDNG